VFVAALVVLAVASFVAGDPAALASRWCLPLVVDGPLLTAESPDCPCLVVPCASSLGVAKAIAGPKLIAAPIPSATAKAPMRPTCAA
jgi:hypothetical protein